MGSPGASLFPCTELSPRCAGREDEDRLAVQVPSELGPSILPWGPPLYLVRVPNVVHICLTGAQAGEVG